jgi:hypothetical protein
MRKRYYRRTSKASGSVIQWLVVRARLTDALARERGISVQEADAIAGCCMSIVCIGTDAQLVAVENALTGGGIPAIANRLGISERQCERWIMIRLRSIASIVERSTIC